MPLPRQHTAILIFANSPKEEAKRKAISNGEVLFDALTSHTLRTVEKTGLPFFHFTEKQQTGSTFGQRFANAVQDVFDKGFEKVVALGNDSPHLHTSFILRAVSLLEDTNLVLGPSTDGGFYLIGLDRSAFQKTAFEHLSWQTSQVKAEATDLFSRLGRKVMLLPVLSDIDTLDDVNIVAQSVYGLDKNVLDAILSLLFSNKSIAFPSVLFTNGSPLQLPFNKGSPYAMSF